MNPQTSDVATGARKYIIRHHIYCVWYVQQQIYGTGTVVEREDNTGDNNKEQHLHGTVIHCMSTYLTVNNQPER